MQTINNNVELIPELHAPQIGGLGIYFFILITIIAVCAVLVVVGLGAVNHTSIAVGNVGVSKKLRCGVATSHTIFSAISSGDSSVHQAALDGGITQISTASSTTRGNWFFSTTTTTVYGK